MPSPQDAARWEGMEARVSRLERETDDQREVIVAIREGLAGIRAEMRVWGIVLGLAMPVGLFILNQLTIRK